MRFRRAATLLFLAGACAIVGSCGSSAPAEISTASPIADPGRRFVYAASPNGLIHKLALADGREASGWPVSITRDATREKIAASLNVAGAYVIATTGGYFGDAPPYQGHVALI